MPDRRAVQSADEMRAFAAHLAQKLAGGQTLLLVGELGSGKTTFIQGLATALGVRQPITSPSFAVVSEYETQHPTIRRLLHVDLYRLLGGAEDPAVAAVREEIGRPELLVAIEWADRLGENVPVGTLWLSFEHGAYENERIVTISGA